MHLIIMGAVDDTTLASSLLANLAKESGRFFMVSAKTKSVMVYASSVVITGG